MIGMFCFGQHRYVGDSHEVSQAAGKYDKHRLTADDSSVTILIDLSKFPFTMSLVG